MIGSSPFERDLFIDFRGCKSIFLFLHFLRITISRHMREKEWKNSATRNRILKRQISENLFMRHESFYTCVSRRNQLCILQINFRIFSLSQLKSNLESGFFFTTNKYLYFSDTSFPRTVTCNVSVLSTNRQQMLSLTK